MFCPLLVIAHCAACESVVTSAILSKSEVDCKGKECAWWRNGACAIQRTAELLEKQSK